MSTVDILRKQYGLSNSLKTQSVLNYAIRASVPGASYVLSALEVINGALSAQKKPDKVLQAIFDQLRQVRAKMCDYVLDETDDSPLIRETTKPDSCYIERQASQPNAPLGTMSDAAAAKLLGVSHFTARKRRVALGIPAFAGNRARIDWARWDAHIVNSTMTTEGLAQTIGCDTSTARERRRFLKSKKGKYAHE